MEAKDLGLTQPQLDNLVKALAKDEDLHDEFNEAVEERRESLEDEELSGMSVEELEKATEELAEEIEDETDDE